MYAFSFFFFYFCSAGVEPRTSLLGRHLYIALSELHPQTPWLKLEQKAQDDSLSQRKSLLNGWQERGVAE